MQLNPMLETFWLTFPQDSQLPMGIGVTAYSEADAFALLEERGIAEWFAGAREVVVRKGVRLQDLDQRNVVPNIGPMQLRGVWYPCTNVGFGGPRAAEYVRLPGKKS